MRPRPSPMSAKGHDHRTIRTDKSVDWFFFTISIQIFHVDATPPRFFAFDDAATSHKKWNLSNINKI
jgi:hypothetical protein